MPIAVGVDLGTSTSEIASLDPLTQKPVVVKPRGEGSRIVPSAVWFSSERGRVVVGSAAYGMRVPQAEEIVLNIKREMGNPDYPPRQFLGKSYGPPEMSAEILRYLREAAVEQAKDSVHQAVIAVPATFDSLARQHVEEAARLAGLEVLQLLPEPVAALLGYPGKKPGEDYTAMVYDFGGGTFDCTVVRARGNNFQVLSKAGARQMGGSHIDELIARDLLGPKVRAAGYEFCWPGYAGTGESPQARQNGQVMLDWAEKAKKSLADPERKSVADRLTKFAMEGDKPKSAVSVEIHQQDLHDLIRPFLVAANEQMAIALDGANCSREDLDFVLLVGGSTRLPAIRESVRQFMGETAYSEGDTRPRKVLADADPDLLVVRGAAVVAANAGQEDKRIQLVDTLLTQVGYREPGSSKYVPLFAQGSDIRSAQRDMPFRWPRGDSIALELYEGVGKQCTDAGVKYVATVQIGPEKLQPGTEGVLRVRYRPDTSLPEASAWVKSNNAPIPTQVLFDRSQVTATGTLTLDQVQEIDLAFCVDVTGSMRYGEALEAFRKHSIEFVHSLEADEAKLNVRFATVYFGDRRAGEREVVYSFTPEPKTFLQRLEQMDRDGMDGGDVPESALDALDTAFRLPFREGDRVRKRIVLVTDAPPQAPVTTPLERLAKLLDKKKIVVDVLGPHCPEYDHVTGETHGRIYDLDVECAQFMMHLYQQLTGQEAAR